MKPEEPKAQVLHEDFLPNHFDYEEERKKSIQLFKKRVALSIFWGIIVLMAASVFVILFDVISHNGNGTLVTNGILISWMIFFGLAGLLRWIDWLFYDPFHKRDRKN